jgi:hypothetical protein
VCIYAVRCDNPQPTIKPTTALLFFLFLSGISHPTHYTTMRSAILIALVLGVVFASVCAQEVVVLNSDNFESTIAEKDLVLVEFFVC